MPPSRPTVNEELLDRWVMHHLRSQRIGNGLAAELITSLQSADKRLMKLIEERVAWIAARGYDTSHFTLQRLERNLVSVRQALREAYRQAGKDFTESLVTASKSEAALLPQVLTGAVSSVVSVGFALPAFSLQLAESIARRRPFHGGKVGEFLSKIGANQADRVRRELRAGLLAGEDWKKLKNRLLGDRVVRTVNGKRKVVRVGGALRAGHREAQTLARSAVNSAFNGMRDDWVQENKSAFRGVEWVSTLDTRTTPGCRARDGHVYSADAQHRPLDGGPPWGAGPGRLHWNCRSTSVPVLKSAQELGLSSEIPEGKRRAMDGLYPGKVTYYEWLARQPAKRQLEVLGRRRFNLYRQGKVNLEGLHADGGELLKVKTLERRVAREAAG